MKSNRLSSPIAPLAAAAMLALAVKRRFDPDGILPRVPDGR